MLYSVGPLVIEAGASPFNANAAGGKVEGGYAEKNVLGRRPPLEAVGEGPETFKLSGIIWPFKLGGLSELELAKQLVRNQTPVSVMRGDGWWKGFYVIESCSDNEEFLHYSGVGQKISYDLEFKRTDAPFAPDFFDSILSLLP